MKKRFQQQGDHSKIDSADDDNIEDEPRHIKNNVTYYLPQGLARARRSH
jgi:hypothetical protein